LPDAYKSFLSAKLTETCADYNRGGMNPRCFNLQPSRYEWYQEDDGGTI